MTNHPLEGTLNLTKPILTKPNRNIINTYAKKRMHNKFPVGDLMKIAKVFANLGNINKRKQFAKIYEIKQTLKLSFFIFLLILFTSPAIL